MARVQWKMVEEAQGVRVFVHDYAVLTASYDPAEDAILQVSLQKRHERVASEKGLAIDIADLFRSCTVVSSHEEEGG